ncbi:MAG: 4Fe-4S dicluster domain-containing protein [Candidatus Diapherotrites archaeon]|nr:4Fe-4S dicluster domain-containing protein [Candidatus Diapherotrites archaeon]
MNFTIKKEQLPSFLDVLAKKSAVFVPVEEDSGATIFAPWEGQQLFLEGRTLFSPKFLFRPSQEKIFFFRKQTGSYEISPLDDKKQKIVFGIRPCDTHALNVLDQLFEKYCDCGSDQFYTSRRKNTVLIALQCKGPCENGFCTSMGTSQPVGHDLLFIERGNDFFVTAATERGKRLLGKKFFKPAKDTAPSRKLECQNSLETKNLAQNLYSNFNHPVWKQEGDRCLSCTSCTQVCPTCYCYFIEDNFLFGSDKESERSRQLDSCQLQRFSKVAGNHVFRKSRAARLRQFVLHKLSYYQQHHGLQLCIGCGRCIAACPVDIDLTKIANEIQKDTLGVKK